MAADQETALHNNSRAKKGPKLLGSTKILGRDFLEVTHLMFP
jgi:hypothetical protein